MRIDKGAIANMTLTALNTKHLALKKSKSRRDFLKSAMVTGLASILVLTFLTPFAYMLFSALKTKEQVSELGAPPAGRLL